MVLNGTSAANDIVFIFNAHFQNALPKKVRCTKTAYLAHINENNFIMHFYDLFLS